MLTAQLAGALSSVPRPSHPVSPFAAAPHPKLVPHAAEVPHAERSQAEVAAPVAVAEQAPVLQLVSIPVTLNPGIYANAISNSNPEGDYTSLAAFQQLTDPIPMFSRYYAPGMSTESLYESVINGAQAFSPSDFTSQVIGSAQKLFAQYALSNMGGVSGVWHPVYASPPDWYDLTQSSRFQPVAIDLSGGGPAVPGFTTLPDPDGADQLAWKVGSPGDFRSAPLDPGTKLQKVTFNAMRVDLSRPWLQFQLFYTDGWQLQGQRPGLISSGSLDTNAGIMPLITTGLILARNVSVTAQWGDRDEEMLQRALSGFERIALGPFALSGGAGITAAKIPVPGTVESRSLQILAWISEIVPFSPPKN